MITQRTLFWFALFSIYSAFTFWYTNTEGPLTDAEIDAYLQQYPDEDQGVDRQVLEQFMRTDTGRQFIMINLLDYNETPTGKFSEQTPEELLGHYMEYMYPELFQRASHPIFAGRSVGAAMDVQGIEGATVWDSGALMRYRSRRDLLEIATNPVFAERHDYKLAALTKTIAYPVEVGLSLADPRFHFAVMLLIIGLLVDRLMSKPGKAESER